ncbi:MAG: chain-length determining protein, partial [Bacteroidaceae bacterium]|nr:chain-length determining protein [Bacteroidaceae bacterium]
PLVCATIADSVRVKLQDFITAYRTNKSRIDEQYYKSLADSARIEYETISRQYSQFCDAHKNIVLQSYLSERDRLENELQTSMSTYNAMQAQYLAAKAKVQEQTPAFTILRAPSVPVKPNGPKRMIFVAAMLFLSTIGTCIYIFRKELVSQFVGSVQN